MLLLNAAYIYIYIYIQGCVVAVTIGALSADTVMLLIMQLIVGLVGSQGIFNPWSISGPLVVLCWLIGGCRQLAGMTLFPYLIIPPGDGLT
jgi:hypothetical protein